MNSNKRAQEFRAHIIQGGGGIKPSEALHGLLGVCRDAKDICIVICRYTGYTFKETGELIGLTRWNVSRRLKRILRRYNDKL